MVKVDRQQAEKNRNALARAADRLSRRDGLRDVRLADISRAAGLTTGAVYARFDGREALLAAGIAAGFDRMIGWMQTCDSFETYLKHVRDRGRQPDGTLECPAISHAGAIRTASAPERAAYRDGLGRMLAVMSQWPDIGTVENARALLARVIGETYLEAAGA